MGRMDKPLTELLREWHAGDNAAFAQLVPFVYEQLRTMATSKIGREQRFRTLTPSDLVNEALIKLMGANVAWQDRSHFYAIAATTMRRILVDHARAQLRDKRGGGQLAVTLQDDMSTFEEQSLLELEEALEKLAEFDQRKMQVLELSYFAGLTQAEIAKVLGISTATVERDLRMGKAWLQRETRG